MPGALFLYEQLVVAYGEYLPQKFDLIGVYMPLTYLYLRQTASCDIASPDLKPGGQLLLGHATLHPQTTDIPSHCLIIRSVHALNTFRTYIGAPCVDSMRKACYNCTYIRAIEG